MTGFDEREKSYEKKFERDQELAFKAKARRNKLVGHWAAQQMGLTGEVAEAYAMEIVTGELQHRGDAALVEKLARDLAANGVALDADRVSAELTRFATEARKQLGIAS